MYKFILALAIIATVGAVQLPSAFAVPPPTSPPSTGCTGNPHPFGESGNPETGNPHFPGFTGNPHIPAVGFGRGPPCPGFNPPS